MTPKYRTVRAIPHAGHSPPLTVERLEDRVTPGSGTFFNGQFNFSVAVLFNANTTQLDAIRDRFQRGSQVLADATDNQHRFGTVTILNNAGTAARGRADYWIFPNEGRAVATYGLYGLPGAHVSMYFPSNFVSVMGIDGDAYTIAHEFGHHAYSIGDSYAGPVLDKMGKQVINADGTAASREDAESAPASAESATLNFSLMDDYFRRGGRGPSGDGSTYTLNEFSVASNHDPDGDTWQSFINKQSDWETLAKSPYAATVPAGLPTDAAPAAHTVTFTTVADASNDNLNLMLVIDRSGSMANSNRLQYAQGGASGVVRNLVAVQPFMGLSSFNDIALLFYPLRQLGTPGPSGQPVEDELRAAINGLMPSGFTNIGGGLEQALNQLPAGTPSAANTIILLSDGDHNTGIDPISVLPQLRDRGIVVLTIGVGNEISPAGEATLQRIARDTGGRYIRVNNDSFGLLGAYFSQLATSLASAPVAESAAFDIGTGGDTRTFTASVEANAEEAMFVFNQASPDIRANTTFVRLITPSGVVIDPFGDPPNVPLGVTFSRDTFVKTFRVLNPEPGEWTMVAQRFAFTADRIQFQAFVDNPGTDLVVNVDDDTVAFPNAITVSATTFYRGEIVLGAAISGEVLRPDDSRVPIVLFDDGRPEHGDLLPNDGVYSNLFNQYAANANGTYTFQLTSAVNGGSTAPGENLVPGAPSNARPVPPFVRMGSATAVVTGVPADVTPVDLRARIQITPNPVIVGQATSYVITVTNNGTTPATGVFAEVILAIGLRIDRITPSQGTATGSNGKIDFQVGDLGPGASATLEVVVTPTTTGPFGGGVMVGSNDQIVTSLPDSMAVQAVVTQPSRLPVGQNSVGPFAVSGGVGNTQARTFSANGTPSFDLTPFDVVSVPGGTRTALADVTGDGVPDLIAGSGPGASTEVRIFDGKSQALLGTIPAFESSFTGGVYVAAGDLNGDGRAEIVITPDEGGGPRVRIFTFAGGAFTQLADFFGIDDINFRGGARAAVGDIDGDGINDLLIVAGFGGGPRIAGFRGATVLNPVGPGQLPPKLFPDFFVFEQTLRNGVFIASGDLNGDGAAEVIAGGGPGGGPRVFALSGRELALSNGSNQVQAANFFAGDPNNRGGVRLVVKNLDGDGFGDLVTGSGTNASPRVAAYAGKDIPINGTPPTVLDFLAFDAGFQGGIFVG